MDGFSRRITAVEPSATLRISDLASELEASGEDVVDLSVGEPDFSTPDHIVDAAKRALDDGETHYTASAGVPDLREAIASKFRTENDLRVDRDDLIVTPGGKQALYEVIMAVLRDGEEAVLLDPAWVSYEAMVKMAGGDLSRVRLDPATGFTLGDAADALAETITDDTKLLIVNSPSNPSGAVFDEDELAAIRDLAVDHDVWVISDEIYEKILYEGEHHSLGAMDGMADRTITVNGFSKAYAMTGWRLGYYAAPEALREQCAKIQSHSVSCATSFAQHGAIAAIDGPQGPVEEMREAFRERRDALMTALAEHGIEFPAPEGAFYAFVPVASDDTAALCEEILQEAHVATTPGSAFGVEGHIRLSYAADRERIEEGVERMAPYL